MGGEGAGQGGTYAFLSVGYSYCGWLGVKRLSVDVSIYRFCPFRFLSLCHGFVLVVVENVQRRVLVICVGYIAV